MFNVPLVLETFFGSFQKNDFKILCVPVIDGSNPWDVLLSRTSSGPWMEVEEVSLAVSYLWAPGTVESPLFRLDSDSFLSEHPSPTSCSYSEESLWITS